MPTPEPELSKSLVSRKLQTKKSYLKDGVLTTGVQNTANISANATNAQIKALSDDIGFFMKATSTSEQPSTAYKLDKFLLQEVEMVETENGDAPVARDAESAREFARRWKKSVNEPDPQPVVVRNELVISFYCDDGSTKSIRLNDPIEDIESDDILAFADDFIDCGAFAFKSGDDLTMPTEIKEAYYHEVIETVIIPGGGE